jgi:hypothetical protein
MAVNLLLIAPLVANFYLKLITNITPKPKSGNRVGINKLILIIMEKSNKMTLIATGFALLLVSCEKEISMPVNYSNKGQSINQIDDFNERRSAYFPDIVYYTCGMKVHVFEPFEYSFKLYSFAINEKGGQNKPFSIGLEGEIDYGNPDKFSFEFAGYADKSQTVKTWRIKRTDGKYLTALRNHYLEYLDKLIGTQRMMGAQEVDQIFLLSSLGNNTYKILTPKTSICNVVAISSHIFNEDPTISSYAYDSPKLNFANANIIMIVNDLPHSTK